MTIHTQMNRALAARGMMPMDGYVSCPCCKDATLDRDDIAVVADYPLVPRLTEKYGAPVCNDCADVHCQCDDCGKAVHEDDAQHGEHNVFCEDCSYTDGGDYAQPVNGGYFS